MLRKHSLGIAIIALLWTLPPRASNAYLPTASSILSSAANRRAGAPFKTLVLEGRAQRPGGKTTRLWESVRAGEGHRIELRDESGTTVVLTRGRKRWRFSMGGSPGTPEAVDLDPIMSFIGNTESDSGGRRGLAFMRTAKINDEVVSLARLDGRVAYVLGARAAELDKPQLWIDKEYLVPIRFIHRDTDGTLVDMKLLGFGSAITGPWYPERIEIWKDGELQEVRIYRSLSINDPVEPSLFRPAT
ncbi:MAG: hypothetical protein IPK13_15220 [Deltaproteobacteria bacterium]|nr:hypothetical protein [Deltaproteobacteria bacterium]